MLGFIISKLNLLIMVTAIFALVAYFTFFFAKGTDLREAQSLLNRFSEDTYGVLSSSGQCHQAIISIPPYIRSIGTGEINNRLRFLMRISKIAGGPSGKNLISFSILRKKDNSVLAAQPFATEAEVKLYQWEEETGAITIPPEPQVIKINPVSAVCSNLASGVTCSNSTGIGDPADSLLLVKEVYHGKTNLYLVPCSSQSGWCSANYAKIVCLVKKERAISEGRATTCADCSSTILDSCLEEEGFNCFSGV